VFDPDDDDANDNAPNSPSGVEDTLERGKTFYGVNCVFRAKYASWFADVPPVNTTILTN
jgi:hypothetical protein